MIDPTLTTAFNRSTSILIVDDQPSNLLALSTILDQQGFTVRQAIDGDTAIETINRLPPNLILLDIRMPLMDGYEVCAQLKSNQATRHIPIIFLSASDDVFDKAKAFSVGGVDYITKPFQVEEVLIRVQHQLTIQSQHTQLLNLNQQLHHLNANLERQVQTRTLELEQALTFERTLKRISDQMRDTLDQNCILQTVVTEVAHALESSCCHATLCNTQRFTMPMHYQVGESGWPAAQEQFYLVDAPQTDAPDLANPPEMDEQLHQKRWFAFCHLSPAPPTGNAAILVCPIFDDQVTQQGILGVLWVFKPTYSSFGEQEIRLVEQVANQSAIALRQAQLYAASQQQVRELERLNQLKDDFLNTISHELRSPLATMKMALQMLDVLTQQGQMLVEHCTQATPNHDRVVQYYEILKQECDRELQLVKDLLDLQHLEAGVYEVELTTLNLHQWLQHIIEAFQIRAQEQHQQLQLEILTDITITIDLVSLSRIVTELLTNACKYTPAQETITLSAAIAPTHLCLRVMNTGVEIPSVELSRIFDKFYRIPNNDPWKHGGTGLGLALIKKLVEQLKGAIEVSSRDRMTCFTVWLPYPDQRLKRSPQDAIMDATAGKSG
ncbi:MAG: response regulator [Leptolyngbyaceae cyanobacterium bins.349]|nr:response regulator [Leptolyngbyaceae cyanobacterium bins.349]